MKRLMIHEVSLNNDFKTLNFYTLKSGHNIAFKAPIEDLKIISPINDLIDSLERDFSKEIDY